MASALTAKVWQCLSTLCIPNIPSPHHSHLHLFLCQGNKHWTLTNHWTHFILLPLRLHSAQSSAEVNTSPNDWALNAVKAATHVVTVVPAVHGANSQHRKAEKIITPSKLIYLCITCKLTEAHSVLKIFPNANPSVSQLLINAHAQPHHLITKQWVTPNFDFSP